MTGRNRTTIYNIAKLAGTSASTVSYALNGTWKERRIASSTVARIRAIADAQDYRPNLQARGLKRAVSGLSGMILPEHDTRFFSDLSQAFAVEVRARGDCPAIVLSGRDPEAQAESVRSLLGYNIDSLVIAGATEPEHLDEMCRAAGLAHVFVDHPCPGAASVITDSAAGAAELTRAMLARLEGAHAPAVHFVGGTPGLPSTEARRAGFGEVLGAAGLLRRPDQIDCCGYDAGRAAASVRALRARLGGLPDALFVNSILCFEGVAHVLATLPEAETARLVLGCFDYDPFVALMRFPVIMVRQRAAEMIRLCFAALDGAEPDPTVHLVRPELMLGRETLPAPGPDAPPGAAFRNPGADRLRIPGLRISS